MSEGKTAWYAVYTRSRHEKQVAAYLARHNLETFLPLRREWSARTDRKVTIHVPALPGYLFVRCVLYAETRALIKRTTGVLRLVESAGQPAVIPEEQVAALRTALEVALHAEGHPFLSVGDRVRVVRGPMIGVEGYLVRVAENRHRLVITVDHVNQALSVEIDGGLVELAN
jgi:transcription antitermination factor NusG